MKNVFVVIVCILALTVSLTGCNTTSEEGALIGGGLGAGTGAIIGHASHHTAAGALIGLGLGALTGAIIGQQMDTMYCPECGRHFRMGMEYCPYDGVRLRHIRHYHHYDD